LSTAPGLPPLCALFCPLLPDSGRPFVFKARVKAPFWVNLGCRPLFTREWRSGVICPSTTAAPALVVSARSLAATRTASADDNPFILRAPPGALESARWGRTGEGCNGAPTSKAREGRGLSMIGWGKWSAVGTSSAGSGSFGGFVLPEPKSDRKSRTTPPTDSLATPAELFPARFPRSNVSNAPRAPSSATPSASRKASSPCKLLPRSKLANTSLWRMPGAGGRTKLMAHDTARRFQLGPWSRCRLLGVQTSAADLVRVLCATSFLSGQSAGTKSSIKAQLFQF
jgi:hypothetical protein